MRARQKGQRRAGLRATGLSLAWRQIIAAQLPIFAKLPLDLRRRLEGLINQFIDEVTFVGCEGQEITDKVRVTIAAQACLLIVNKPNRWYKTLDTIYVYPSAFKSQVTEYGGFLKTEKEVVRLGESWERGPVVLAWDHSAYGGFMPDDGANVVFHEFAHQLDQQTGAMDGAPLLDRDQNAGQWGRVMQAAFERHKAALERGQKPLIDPYGASAPAEFFAVVTELFFERPHDLRKAEPHVYREVAEYFKLDPATWEMA